MKGAFEDTGQRSLSVGASGPEALAGQAAALEQVFGHAEPVACCCVVATIGVGSSLVPVGRVGEGRRLVAVVRGQAQNHVRSEGATDLLDRRVVLAEVDPVGFDVAQQVPAVVQQERHAGVAADGRQQAGAVRICRIVGAFVAQLHRFDAALDGRYRIERELGEGGMATVYLADDLKHERKVALKVLKPELAAVVGAERFLAEIKTTANLQHPHILPLFDSGEADSFLFYVMPYVEGESLRDRLAREKQLPVDEAARIASEVADALDYAHRQGVIHRDIKPANILLHDGRPVVADFGIAVAVSAAGGGRIRTLEERAVCSPRRWARRGVWRTNLVNQLVMLWYRFGATPRQIFRFYYGKYPEE